MDNRVVQAGVIEPGVMLGHVLAVIAKQHDHGLVQDVTWRR